MTDTGYQAVTAEQIEQLEARGCSAEDWAQVRVAPEFSANTVSNTVFAGEVTIGKLEGSVKADDGCVRTAGIRNASLRDVSVDNGCCIANVNGWLSNLNIGSGALIENVGTISCTGESSFGNGHEIEPLNEGGGREIKITTETSAQIAYLTVLYRHREAMVAKLNEIADSFAAQLTGSRAVIGENSCVMNSNELVDVSVGPFAVVNGAASLRNGTIDSSEEAPSVVGNAVVADDFIMQKGSSVKDGAMISGSLIGEASKIGKQFSAENSMFFANSEGFHSEACSFFGGPYSVTHHRSTLMIAAITSFYNAGSGTNQSNHMYKLGPLHQGIMERGCKTGSFSYLLWPSRVGAFTAVIGKHYANFDTVDFPFSYIDDDKGKSALVPGMNFFTVGTLRDGAKWPARDKRKNSKKLDLLIFDVLSPFTSQKMLRGREILLDLHAKSEKGQVYVSYNGINIKRLLLKTCARYYNLALDKYLGDVLMAAIEDASPEEVVEMLHEDHSEHGIGEWTDVCGLLASQTRVDNVVKALEDGKIADFAGLHAAMLDIYESYEEDEWAWVAAHYDKFAGAKPSIDDLRVRLDKWKNASLKLLNMVIGDAQKEFEGAVRTGFGIDGEQDADFDAVRGTFEDNKFVKQLQDDIRVVEQRYDDAIKQFAQA